MKRNLTSLKTSIYQVQLGNIDLERNHDSFLRNENDPELRNLHDFLTLLTPSLVRDELIFFKNLFSQEIKDRTAALCESIPDEVWMNVFRLLANNKDISTVFPLRQVNKKWYNSLCYSLTEAHINRSKSLQGLYSLHAVQRLHMLVSFDLVNPESCPSFSNLQHLSLGSPTYSITMYAKIWPYLTSLTSLSLSEFESINARYLNEIPNFRCLTNLKCLEIRSKISSFRSSAITRTSLADLVNLTHFNNFEDASMKDLASFSLRYGQNYEILNSFKHLKEAKLFLYASLINCKPIQEKYPSVRFIWRIVRRLPHDVLYYEGDFNDFNQYHGKGKITYSTSNCKYEGDFQNNEREGKGVFFYPSGERFEGEWKNDKREGPGIIFHSNGGRTEGIWRNDMREGKFLLTFPYGSYEGEWKNDQKEPYGIFRYRSGAVYQGEFKNEKHHFASEGNGVIVYPNGARYEGQWKNDKREGYGIYCDANDNRYKGQWKNDMREGQGLLLFTSGLCCHFDGIFKNDKKEGNGIMVYSNGDRYKGEWKNDKKEGIGIMIYANGEKYEGEWKNDEKVSNPDLT